MVQNLLVNGNEYLPSAELAQRFGYTPDYVSRLAREGKVLATNVNRKWFVSEESLSEFAQLTILEKEIRAAELKKQRQAERALHSLILKKEQKGEAVHVHVALTQALAVFMCGSFVGLLGWTISGNNIGLSELTHGLSESYVQIAEAVIPKENPFEFFADWSVATVVQKPVVSNDASKSFVREEEYSNASISSEDVESLHLMEFSDEVEVDFHEDGSGVVRPVFKNKENRQEYQMFVAPTNAVTN